MDFAEIPKWGARGREWVRTKRFSSREPDPSMEEWFDRIAARSYQIVDELRKVRRDGSIDLGDNETVEIFLRTDLSNGLLSLLQGEEYNWGAALSEFTDPIWRDDPAPDQVSDWSRVSNLGEASAELGQTLDQLLESFRAMKDWEYVGRLLRRAFIQICRELIVLEVEIARLGELEL
jgi:hypothetical protein